MSTNKDYLGDSVYADISEYGELVLTTENGVEASNKIIMEPEVLNNMFRYLQRMGMIKENKTA